MAAAIPTLGGGIIGGIYGSIKGFFSGDGLRGLTAKDHLEKGAGIGAALAGAKNLANGIVRVFGQRGAPGGDKSALVAAGVNFLQDRFKTDAGAVMGSKNVVITSFFCTQDITSDAMPFIELRISLLLMTGVALKALVFPAKITGVMSFANDYTIGGLPAGPGIAPRQFPNSSNTRGSWIGALAIAALKSSLCDLPPVATDPGPTIDTVVLL
jgi:hypothetical protein